MIITERFAGTSTEWDAVVRSCAGSSHQHLYGWKRVLERVFPHPCMYLAARDEHDELVGVLPLVHVSSFLFGRYLVSMPFLNYGGPLGTVEAMTALTARAVELADDLGVHLIELRCREQLGLDLDVSHRKVTVLLDLPDEDPDVLWRALDAKVRSQIRRPQKEGVVVRFGSDQLDAFYEVFARHMRDLGTPTQSPYLFSALAEEFGESIWFGAAYLAGKPIAAGCGFRWADEFEMTWAAALREHSRIAPNMLLYWRFIERSVSDGARIFNFGRCTAGSGTHRFKRQWGGRDEALWWYHRNRGRAATPSPDDRRFRWGPTIWQRLPVRLATWMGPQIVRYLP